MGEQQSMTLPPEYTGLTFEKVWAMFQETDKKFQKTDEKFQETERLMKERSQETERLMKEHSQETEKKFQEAEKLVRQNQKMMGDLGRKFGKIIEHMFIPNLEEKFNALGYEFGKAGPNVRIANKKHNIFAEIDVFLENGDCALAVEVKTQASTEDVQEHVDRMKKLRQYFDLQNDKRKLFGAIAAAVILDNVRDYAFKQGFYVIKQSGDNVRVEEPENKAKAW
jgi:hypothetical protein